MAMKIAEYYGTSLGDMTLNKFSDGEMQPSFNESVRGCDLFLVQSTTPPGDNLLELLLMIDAAKRASANSITVVIPYYGYARQDRKDKPRVSIGSKMIADVLSAAGANRVITMDLHAPQIQGFFDGPVDHLWALPLLADYVADKYVGEALTVVSPDSGRVRVADIWAERLGAPLAIIHKRRDPDRPNQVEAHELVGDVKGRTCLLVDDMIDTGGTIVAAAQALKKNGAAKVIVAATHAVFSNPAVERLSSGAVDEVVVTNTLPITQEKQFDQLTVLSIAPLIAAAISAVFGDDSVNKLFPGHA